MVWKTLFRLVPFIRPHSFWLLLSIFCALCLAILKIAFAYLIKNLTDTVLSRQYNAFIELIYLALVLVAVGMLVTYFSKYAIARYKTETIRDLRNNVTGHLQQLPMSFVDRHHTGDIVSRLNTDVSKIDDLLVRIPDYVYQPLLFTGAFIYLWLISWKLLLATFVLIPISALVFNKISRPIEKYSRQFREHLAEANALSQDTINGIFIAKAFNLQETLSQKYKAVVEQVETKGLYVDKVDATLLLVWLVLRFTPQLVCPLYGGYLIIQGELTVGGLLACVSLMWYVFLPIEAFLDLLRQIRETAPVANRVFYILDQPTEQIDGCPFEINPEAKPLEFKNVSFGYDEKRNILNNLSFQVPKDKIVALVGPSGCGKSTVFKLLCGFYKPYTGAVELYGNDIHQSDLSAIRTHISLVSQDVYLFPATIAENIGYGRLDATKEEIIAAAKVANAHDFIMELPQNYDTPIGERGSRLSGGQRQRIALARAVLKDAPILLLDEPTSALDTQSEALVKEALARLMKQRTVLVIAHRLSTIKEADQVLVLDQGQIIESGSHDQLLKKESLYKKLHLKQTTSIE